MASIVKRGDFQYQAQIRTKGYPPQCKTFESMKEAKAWVAVIRSEQVRGVFIDRNEAERTTFGEALERYLQEVTPNKKGSRAETGLIRRLKKHPLSLRSLASLRSADFAAYRDARIKAVKPNTVRIELALMSHLFTVANRDWSIHLGNPVLGIRKPKLPRGRDRRLEGDEEKFLLEAAAKSNVAVYLTACIKLAIETGMRGSEILNLDWRDIKFDVGYIQLEYTKNGDGRIVPLSEAAECVLQSLPRSLSGRVINAFFDITGLDRAFRLACKRANLRDLNFHDLRHEAASRIAPALPVQTLAKIFGWRTIQMAMRYYNPKAKELVAAFRRISKSTADYALA